MASFFFFAALALLARCAFAECPVYLPDDNDIVYMDTEQRGGGGGWNFSKNVPGYRGSGYLEYKPLSSFGGIEPKPYNYMDPRIKTYFFTVTKPGIYRIMLRSAAPHWTEHNDLWMSLPESGAQRTKDGVNYEVIASPVPEQLMVSDYVNPVNWFKVYQNAGDNTWNNGGFNVDFDGHVVSTLPLDAEQEKWYSIRIAGRSTQFKVDRITVFRCEDEQCAYHLDRYSMASTYDGPQSECGGLATAEPEADLDETLA